MNLKSDNTYPEPNLLFLEEKKKKKLYNPIHILHSETEPS